MKIGIWDGTKCILSRNRIITKHTIHLIINNKPWSGYWSRLIVLYFNTNALTYLSRKLRNHEVIKKIDFIPQPALSQHRDVWPKLLKGDLSPAVGHYGFLIDHVYAYYFICRSVALLFVKVQLSDTKRFIWIQAVVLQISTF